MIRLDLSIDPIAPATSNHGEDGAEIRFLGIVRGLEDGTPISGITYTAYLPMARKVLETITEEMQAEHGAHPVHIQHRLGFVAVGDPSVVITTSGKHSAETFERLRQYLHRVKTEVPIWKEFVSLEC